MHLLPPTCPVILRAPSCRNWMLLRFASVQRLFSASTFGLLVVCVAVNGCSCSMRVNSAPCSTSKLRNPRLDSHLVNSSCGRSVAPPPRERHSGVHRSACSTAQNPSQVAFSRTDSSWKQPLLDPISGSRHSVCVALGKFDAMHIGHRLLAIEAANLGGYPCMMSFSGLAKELNLPARKPLTADIDRERILVQWAQRCGGKVPMQVNIPFADIRMLQPVEFIDILVDVFDVKGVVVGANYRFGYQAKGDTDLLQREGKSRGLLVKVMELESASHDSQCAPEVTSSSRIRECLRKGQVQRIHKFLDRPYAVILSPDWLVKTQGESEHMSRHRHWWFQKDMAMNQVSGEGIYDIVLCVDSSSDVLSTGRLTVCSDQVAVELEQAIDIPTLDAEYLRFEMR